MSKMPENFTINAKKNRCPTCLNDKVYVVDKRNKRGENPLIDRSRRRRKCDKCGHRWTTIEIHQKIWATIGKFLREAEKIQPAKNGESAQPIITISGEF